MGEEIKQGLTLQSTAHEKPRTGLPLYRNILFDIFSTAKVQQNFETAKDLAKKHCHRRTTEHVSSLTLCLSKNLIARSQQQQPKKSTGNRRTGRRISFQSNCRFQC